MLCEYAYHSPTLFLLMPICMFRASTLDSCSRVSFLEEVWAYLCTVPNIQLPYFSVPWPPNTSTPRKLVPTPSTSALTIYLRPHVPFQRPHDILQKPQKNPASPKKKPRATALSATPSTPLSPLSKIQNRIRKNHKRVRAPSEKGYPTSPSEPF